MRNIKTYEALDGYDVWNVRVGGSLYAMRNVVICWDENNTYLISGKRVNITPCEVLLGVDVFDPVCVGGLSETRYYLKVDALNTDIYVGSLDTVVVSKSSMELYYFLSEEDARADGAKRLNEWLEEERTRWSYKFSKKFLVPYRHETPYYGC